MVSALWSDGPAPPRRLAAWPAGAPRRDVGVLLSHGLAGEQVTLNMVQTSAKDLGLTGSGATGQVTTGRYTNAANLAADDLIFNGVNAFSGAQTGANIDVAQIGSKQVFEFKRHQRFDVRRFSFRA